MLRILIVLFAVHFMGDFYALFYAPAQPFLKEKFSLGISGAAALMALYLGLQNYLQPVFGWVSERVGRRWLVIGGLVAAAIGMSFLGFAGNVGVLAGLLIVGAVGVAAFHPCGAALAGEITSEHRHLAMSVYILGGHFGCVAAPLVIPALAKHDMRLIGFLAIGGIVFAAALMAWLPKGKGGSGVKEAAQPVSLLRTFKAIWVIHLLVLLRFIPIQAYLNFLPLLERARGVRQERLGWSFAAMMLAGAGGMMLGSWLSRRVARRPLILLSNLGAGVCWLAALHLEGVHFYWVLCLGSALAFFVMPLLITIAQELAPRAKGLAAGGVMGLAYGNASLVLIPLGRHAEGVKVQAHSELAGLVWFMEVSSVAFFLAAALGLFMKLPGGAADTKKGARADE